MKRTHFFHEGMKQKTTSMRVFFRPIFFFFFLYVYEKNIYINHKFHFLSFDSVLKTIKKAQRMCD
jgi:hypothetical protein